MFSKLNQEFASHQKGFQILLGIVIIVPFVMMIPGVDPFGGGGAKKPAYVGTIAGNDVDWDSYEAEAKNLLILNAIEGQGLPSNYGDALMNTGFQGDVLRYMAQKKIIKSQIDNGLIKDAVTKEDKQKFVNQVESFVKMRSRSPFYKVADQIETIRVRLRVGGAQIDEVIKYAILGGKINEALKASVEVSEETLTAEIKKQEKTYRIHEASYSSMDFMNEPLKEYYEKNKEKFFRKDAIKASLVQIDFNKFEEAYSKLNVKPELDKFVSDALNAAKSTDAKIIEATKKAAEEDFKLKKLKELANAKAEQIQSAFSRSVKAVKDSSKFAETIKTIAKQSDYSVQDSVYVEPAEVKDGKYYINKELSEKILELSVEKPVIIHEGFRSVYVIVFNDKGTHAELSSVRNELLKGVYDADANNYYVTNKETFKRERSMRVGLAQFSANMFVAEAKVSDEEVKAAYEKVAKYKKAQRKLIQFVISIDKTATEEQKKESEEKLKAFVALKKGNSAIEIENMILKPEEKIVKSTLDWQVQNSSMAGANTKVLDAAFKTEVGQFTEIIKDEGSYAVLYVAAKRDNTPFEEVKGDIKSQMELDRSTDIAREKAAEFHAMLESVNPKTIASINEAVSAYEKSNAVNVRYLENIRELDQRFLNQPGFAQYVAQMHEVPVDYFFKLSRLNENKLFTIARSIQNPRLEHSSRVVGFVKEIIAEHYADIDAEETKQEIYDKLNDNKTKELAAAHAVKVKQELEKLVEDKEAFKAKLTEYEFKKAADIKFKNAKPAVKAILETADKAGFIGSDSPENGANTVVYVESITEISEEDLKKFKDEHEKNLKTKLGNEKIQKFWETESKKFTVKVPEAVAAES